MFTDPSFIQLSKIKIYIYQKPNICNIGPAYKECKTIQIKFINLYPGAKRNKVT